MKPSCGYARDGGDGRDQSDSLDIEVKDAFDETWKKRKNEINNPLTAKLRDHQNNDWHRTQNIFPRNIA